MTLVTKKFVDWNRLWVKYNLFYLISKFLFHDQRGLENMPRFVVSVVPALCIGRSILLHVFQYAMFGFRRTLEMTTQETVVSQIEYKMVFS